VSGRAKLVLLLVIIAAILYVLISPLPELAATSSLKFPVLPFLLIILLTGVLVAPERKIFWMRITSVSERDILWSRSPVLLC
jgi:hypothetical protein